MIRQIKDGFALSQRFDVATEDILFIDMNISGVKEENKGLRIMINTP